eukprot:TRINITY_DN9963_c0_g1_i2.p1 TRINITY_DN9963_c0_g1~~TRINITY_DN9963_c0_g1_i2.p1  ORF type:complete len:313 (+),score=32.66 TRINITY_DN9963_c0_g1_i2:23-940(+)
MAREERLRFLLSLQLLTWTRSLADGEYCRRHSDCGVGEYCFSYELCMTFINTIPFHLGDQVKIVHRNDTDPICDHGAVVGLNEDETYNIECLSSGSSASNVRKENLDYKDDFQYGCSDVSDAGNCGPLQLCEPSEDSIDGRCPDASDNKTWPMCIDLYPEVCAMVPKSPRLCTQPFHGPNVTSICCIACAKAAEAHTTLPAKGSERSTSLGSFSLVENGAAGGQTVNLLISLGAAVALGAAVVFCFSRRQRRLSAAQGETAESTLSNALASVDAGESYTEMTTPRGERGPSESASSDRRFPASIM